MTTDGDMEGPRFVVRDRLDDSPLARVSSQQPRYQVLDRAALAAGQDPIYSEFVSKGTAVSTAQDLNKGLYGPLAEDA